LFQAKAMPELQSPVWEPGLTADPPSVFATAGADTGSSAFTVVR
jgi:hypothetical protein